ncbi:MAG: class I SAM-dependent methyltransferase [Chloroflexota bacterium]
MNVNFGKTATDYATHRAGFPLSFFERLTTFDIGLPDQQIVDLGTGTGTLARGFAQQGSNVIGIDPAESMLESARELSKVESIDVAYRVGKAEETGLPDACADVVTAGQCWHWFDRPAAIAEVKRILRPNGKLVIAHFDWIPLPGNVVAATEALIIKHNPAWEFHSGCGVHPQWVRDVSEAGFSGVETFSYDVDALYTHESWRGRIRASAGVAASLAPEQVAVFDAELAELLAHDFPEARSESGTAVMGVHHRVFAVIGVIGVNAEGNSR